ncbi:MAG TPA: acylphosphatase [Pseudorhizobium sp.]|nr:acylphosphatase [Pseudorhizobium sp.]
METKAVTLCVTGRVQGVAFRAWTREQATRLGLGGSVRNEADGSVAVLLVGPAAAVDQMIELLREGPPAASVAGVQTTEADPQEVPGEFKIVR